MERESERLDTEQLQRLSTGALLRHVLEEARLLVRAEVLVAREELKQEVAAARTAGLLLGTAAGLGLSALSVLFVCVALALPLPDWLGALVVGLVLLGVAALCAALGKKRLPKKPLPRTQARLKTDLALTREQLQ